MVLGRNRVEPSNSSQILQKGYQRLHNSRDSPAPIHKSQSPLLLPHPLAPFNENSPTRTTPNGQISSPNASFKSTVSTSVYPISTSRINGDLRTSPAKELSYSELNSDDDEYGTPVPGESNSDKSNGTILSAATLDAVTVPPRRMGPLFPDNLSRETRNADIVIPGLEYLTSIDQLNIKNRNVLIPTLIGCGEVSSNAFAIKNLLGQKVFQAEEDQFCTSFCFCCQTTKSPSNLTLKDNRRRRVLQLVKPVRSVCHCFPCCFQVVTVSSPAIGNLGSVHHEWSTTNPRLSIKNSQEKTQFTIEGPSCTCFECQKEDVINFPVISESTGEQVGRISRYLIRRIQATDKPVHPKEDYNVSFSKDLPVAMKAVCLAAVFLLDTLYTDLSLPISKIGNEAL